MSGHVAHNLSKCDGWIQLEHAAGAGPSADPWEDYASPGLRLTNLLRANGATARNDRRKPGVAGVVRVDQSERVDPCPEPVQASPVSGFCLRDTGQVRVDPRGRMSGHAGF